MKDNVFYRFINKRMLFFTALSGIISVLLMYYAGIILSVVFLAVNVVVLFIFSDRRFVAALMSAFLIFTVGNSYITLSCYEKTENKACSGNFIVKVMDYPEYTDGRVKCRVKSMNDIPQIGVGTDDDIFLYVYTKDGINIVHGGIYEISGKITSPSSKTTPGAYDYKSYLLSSGVKYTIKVDERYVTYIMTEDLPFYYDKILDMRRGFEDSISHYMSQTSAGLLKGIMFGSSETDGEILGDFRSLGIAHVLAVSGLHVGIIYGAILWVYSFMKVKSRKVKVIFYILSNAFILFYIALSGFSVSCIRAAFLIFISSSASLSGRYAARYDTLSALSLICMINMMLSPFCVFGAGFILSYLSVTGIIFLNPVITAFLRKYLNGRIKNMENIIPMLTVSLSVTLSVSPVSMLLFGEMSIMGFLYNVLMVPAVSVCLILGIAGFFIPVLSYPALSLCGTLLDGIIYAAKILAENDFLKISSDSVSIAFMGIYYIALSFIAGYMNIKSRTSVKAAAALTAVVLAVSLIKYLPPKYSSVSFLDVDFGDCAVIRTKDNDCILIDGGGGFYGGDTANEVILPYLRSEGIKKIDAVIATHSDADHMDGIIGLVGNIPIDIVFANEDGGRLYYALREKCIKNSVIISELYSGDTINFDDCEINILSPEHDGKYISLNDHSIVLSADVGGVKYLFTGDASKNAEKTVMENHPSFSMEYDILKAPHHGSAFANDEFLLRLFCDVCVISVGNNGYGLPDEEFTDALSYAGTNIFRTDESGLIKISSLEDGKYKIMNYMGKWRKIYESE